jgi:signal transduction histidine kinase
MRLSEYLADTHTTMSGPDLHEHLLSLARTGQKMSNIITELLLFASLNKEEVELAPLEMAPLVEAALHRLSYALQEAQAEVILPDSYPPALGYAPWVEEIWFNYLSNALKYGGRPPHVEMGGMV